MFDGFFTTLITKLQELTSESGLDPSNLELTSSLFSETGIVNSIFDAFRVVGIGLTVIFFILEINKIMAFERNDVTLRSFFSPFLKLFIALVVLANAGWITSKLLDVYNLTLDTVNTAIETSKAETVGGSANPANGDTDTLKQLNETIGNNFAVGLGVFIISLLGWLLAQVAHFFWIFKTITFKIELIVRTCFVPVAFADIYSGERSSMIRYAKGFLAMGIYGAALIAVPAIGTALGQGDLLDILTLDIAKDADYIDIMMSFITPVMLPLAELGVVSGVKQIANEALGL